MDGTSPSVVEVLYHWNNSGTCSAERHSSILLIKRNAIESSSVLGGYYNAPQNKTSERKKDNVETKERA